LSREPSIRRRPEHGDERRQGAMSFGGALRKRRVKKKRRQLAPAVDVSTTAFGERAPPMDGKCERLDWIEPATGPRLALRLAMAEAV
jgi:hypothetical protein